MCFPKRFYPLRRRHQISPPRSGPVTRVFEFTTEDMAYDLPQGLKDLMVFLHGEKAVDFGKFNGFRLWQMADASLKRIFATGHIIRRDPIPFGEKYTVVITTPSKVSPKLASYFHNRG